MYGDGIILMGIHKGYSIDDKLNYCTMITKEVIGTLKKWVMKMKGSLKELNIKENISIKAKEITQVQTEVKLNKKEKEILELNSVTKLLRQQLTEKDKLIQ